MFFTGDIEFMRSHDIDPFIMPKASTLVMLNASHHIVKEVKLPTADQIAALDSDTLPPRELLDPLVMRGARWRLLEKGTAEIKQLLQDMRPPQLFHKDVTPRQDAALRTLLVKDGSRGGAGLEAAFVDSIKDRGMLFTIARILLGPHGQSTMIVETQYGMTNRLRAYGSAKAIAESSGRFLVVIWEPDFHFAAPLEHVFSAPRGVHVVSDGALIRALLTLKETKRSFVQFDLMDPAQKSTLIDPRIPQHIYVRSAFQILCKQSYGMTNILAMRCVKREMEKRCAMLTLVPYPSPCPLFICVSFPFPFQSPPQGIGAETVRQGAGSAEAVLRLVARGGEHGARAGARGDDWRARAHGGVG